MNKIPITDLNSQYKKLKPELTKAISRVLESQQFVLGPETKFFEKKFSQFCHHKYAVAVGSGTDALLMCLIASGFTPGDEVVVPVFTFIATAEVVSLFGGKLKFCDVSPETGLIDIKNLKLSSSTKFIIPVHLYGQIAPMQEVVKFAKKHRLTVIEDAAQAHGSIQNKKQAPITGMAAYSFYPAKNLGAFGDGGAIVTDDRKLYEKLILLRNHGQKPGKKYTHYSQGYNFRLDEIQSAILGEKIKYLGSWITQRRQLAHLYDTQLKSIGQISILNTLTYNHHAYHLYTIKAAKRNQLMKFLNRHGVNARVHYPTPLHLQPAYRYLGYKPGSFPNAELLSRSVLSLPLYPELSPNSVKKVCKLIKKFYQ